MFEHQTQVRVRYGETDQMGVVYYGFYAWYYEVGRVEAMRALDMPYAQLEKEGIEMPVLEVQSKYIKPARYDALLTLKTRIEEIPMARILFATDIYNSDNELIHSGIVKLAFINRLTNRPMRCPEQLHNKLKPYFK